MLTPPASPIQNAATTKLVSDSLFLLPVSSVMNEWDGWGRTKVTPVPLIINS